MFHYKTPKTEIIVTFHNSLNERDKRRHAAMIYRNSPWTIEYVSNLLSISENTIRKGYIAKSIYLDYNFLILKYN